MTEARKELDEAISDLIDDYEAKTVEPAPSERKIDGAAFIGWHRSIDTGLILDGDCNAINSHGKDRDERSGLILYAAYTMNDVMDLINRYDEATSAEQSYSAPEWLQEAIRRLRHRVIHSGFERDLKQ